MTRAGKKNGVRALLHEGASRFVRLLEIPFAIYRLNLKERFVEGAAHVFGRRLAYPDSASCVSMFRDIFYRRLYAFACERPDPVIVDLGANIGMSVIFFKRLFPSARITAVEADPRIFSFLERNLETFGIRDARLINAAAHDRVAELGFYSEGADGGHVAEGTGAMCRVTAVDTRALLEEHPMIDMLKMDIEGAEGIVLRHCAPALRRARHVYIEHHGKTCALSLGEVLRVLDAAGFDCRVQHVAESHAPLVEMRGGKPQTSCADQCHVFAVNRSQDAPR